MVWEVMNTSFINIWNVGDREPVQSCPALDVMVWEVPNIIILNPIMTFVYHGLESHEYFVYQYLTLIAMLT